METCSASRLGSSSVRAKRKAGEKYFRQNGKRWANNNPASVVHRGRPRDRFIILAVRFQLTCRPHVRSPIPSFLPSCFLSSAANVSQHDQNLRRADQFLPDKWSRASSAIFIQPSFPSPLRPNNFLINDRGQPSLLLLLLHSIHAHTASSQVD